MTRRSMAIWGLVAAGVAIAGWLGYRTVSARRLSQEIDRLVELLRLSSSSRVADVGAGSGAYTIELARRVVTQGHVFATEIDEQSVAALQARAARAGLENISVIQARADATGLPQDCCDAAFLRGVYHHITEPAPTVASLAEALRPGGRLAIIDFEPSWLLSIVAPVRGVPENRGGHGVPPSVVVEELSAAGFRLIERDDEWVRGQYCLVFEAP